MPAPKGHPPYNINGEGGRPKKYTEEVINKEAEALEEWMKDKNNLFIEMFAFERGIHEDNIADFDRNNERFRRVYKTFKMRQKGLLYEGGLKRKFAHPMCALVLSNSHGVYLKTEQKVTGDQTNSLAITLQQIDGTTTNLVKDESTKQ
jgi:hypothetical protein